jgi:hypothetical protein
MLVRTAPDIKLAMGAIVQVERDNERMPHFVFRTTLLAEQGTTCPRVGCRHGALVRRRVGA